MKIQFVKRTFSSGISWIAIVMFGVAIQSCSFSSDETARLLNESLSKRYDLVIIPGIPYDGTKWNRIMKARVYWSKYLFDKGIAKNLMYSGSSVSSPYYEAEVMALYAEAIGIPRENIFTEIKAEHSTENVFYSYMKARKLGFGKIALASDPFQTRMLHYFTTENVSPDIAFVPIVFDTLKSMEAGMIDPPVDCSKAFKKDFIPLSTRESFLTRFMGTLGYHIDKDAYK